MRRMISTAEAMVSGEGGLAVQGGDGQWGRRIGSGEGGLAVQGGDGQWGRRMGSGEEDGH